MSDAPVTDRERYGVAASHGQLRQRAERPTAADTIAAAGMAGRREPLGLALWRTRYANDRGAYLHAQALLTLRVANVARRRRWQEAPKTLKILTASVMRWSVFGVCPDCMGRGHPVIGESEGRQVLSDDLCNACHGDGATPIERAIPVQHIGRARDIHQLLLEADDVLADRMRHAMRGPLRIVAKDE